MSSTQNDDYRVVRLMKNHIYPTYQLHAFMASRKTAPRDGLRLAALVATDWLRRRLGDDSPAVLAAVPGPDTYLAADDSVLPSLHLNNGYVVDIVSTPELGVWSLQITEPDLGSDPGNPNQERDAVPGRVIETNVAFRATDIQLECGFQTLVSDPEGVDEPADVYRLAIVKRLANHPDFGLRQVTDLSPALTRIETAAGLKSLASLYRDDGNQLPLVVFTCLRPEAEVDRPALQVVSPIAGRLGGQFTPIADKPTSQEPSYDMEAFARSGLGYCRTYLLDDALLDRFNAQFSLKAEPGDIAVLEPRQLGCAYTLPYRFRKSQQAEAMAELTRRTHSFLRGKGISFGGTAFLSAAREQLFQATVGAMQRADETSDQWAREMEAREQTWASAVREKDAELDALRQQIERLRQYQAQLEDEKSELREQLEAAKGRELAASRSAAEETAYYKRRVDRPADHSGVADWAAKHLSSHLILHPKAIGLLEDKDARKVDIDLICDALDFLATDYWSNRYERISDEEMFTRCSAKYHRPFEIKPTGSTTIEFTPAQYKIKYFPGRAGKPVESPLTHHLGVGNDPENLLRVYFLHDDEKKLIVIGSLPCHLKAVSIKA